MSIENMTNLVSFDCCENTFQTFQPTFGDYSLPCCSSCGGDSPSSEGSWGCFSSESDPLTPPLSPNIELPAIDTFTSSFLTNPSTSSVDEFLCNNFSHNFPPVLPDLKEACSEVFDEAPSRIHDPTRKVFNQSSSKDCMWNGRNHRTRRQSRSASPGSPSCSPVSGCVDPRYVFSHFNDRRKSSSPRRFHPIKGLDTPTDSEEEVDVVTVEKNYSKTSSHSAAVGVICDDGKVLGTLMQKKATPPTQLALVTTAPNRLKTITTNQQARGRSNIKAKAQPAMSMVISGGNGTKTLQLKCVPVISTNSSQLGVKRKLSASGEQPASTVVHLMRLTPTSPTSSIGSDISDESESTGGKRRFLSLEGVSMVSDTGINRPRNEVKPMKTDPGFTKLSSFPMQTVVKPEKSSVGATTARKKPTRKYTKRSVATPYETPTSSPGSSNGEAPSSPAKRRNCSGRSSGSEEDSIRAAHNVLERQRREGLRNLYSELRNYVPELAETERAPKVHILTKAKDHVMDLRRDSAELQRLKIFELEKHEILQQRLHKVTTQLATVGSNPAFDKRIREMTAEMNTIGSNTIRNMYF